ncbi:MAG: cyclic nucleotide-binding domain-containing protein [Pseudomonadota bacterium]
MGFWKKNNVEVKPLQLPDTFRLIDANFTSKKDIREMLAGTWLFSDLDQKNIEIVAAYAQCYEVDAGTVLFKEGDAGNYMCVLTKGQVEIFKEDQLGAKHHLAFIRSGNTFGEMSLVDHEVRSATCVATQDSVLLLLTRHNYGQIILDKPTLAINILIKLARLISQRLRNMSGQIVDHL